MTNPSPHPMLKAALSTLDMTIESEMSLFRHYQTLEALPETEIVAGEADDPQRLLQGDAELPLSSTPVAPDISPSEQTTLTTEEATQTPKGDSPNPAEDLTPSELALFLVNTKTETTETETTESQNAILESPSIPPFEPGTVTGAPLPLVTATEDPHQSALDPAIEDYLDSSTALRQHLEESSVEPESPSASGWFNPKKAVLLLGLGLFGVVAMVLFINTTGSRKQLRPAQQPRPVQTPPPLAKNNTDSVVPSTSPSPRTPPGNNVATQVPDLSSKEFADVTGETVSRLEPRSSPTPATPARPTPAPTTRPQNAQQSVPIIKEPTAQAGRFYIVVPYNNPASLTQAQKFVPTAFLTEGTEEQQVQVGALETMEEAQELAQDLRAKGLSAAIISPN